MMVSFLLGKQNFSFIIEGRTGEKQWGCPLSAGCYSRKQGDLQTVRHQTSDIKLPQGSGPSCRRVILSASEESRYMRFVE